MSTLLLHHSSYLDHLTPVGHPERPDRLRAVDRILEHEKFQALERDLAPVGTVEDIARAHPMSYVDMLHNLSPDEGLARVDADTTMSPGTWEAALRGVGGACRAVDEVLDKKVQNAFSASRPPGHHAEKDRAMGFCFFNNVAVAARYAQNKYGLDRVAIIDFDVHHGNGTQDIFWSDPSVMYCSTHQMPLYPGSGAADETGDAGTIVNAPLPPGADGTVFKEAMDSVILPRLNDFRPELVIISAGFDAHMRDPLGGLNFTETDFAWATRALMGIADQHADGRVVSVLEGGYDLEGLARSVAAHVLTLMDA
ncbi:acetoin utilization deacetylase AcuC-like enzyme [Roseibium hamelinense]|uniref:Acetoin utilization deacetylase AcuC-like enzyme n=1 Tax=Roseibium hamelinense TaxID=150831 RepID=A0A562SU30_9HYPH|nr:histone deacetylase family protein [Roseibium hamelinense]MTI42704.1 histone deacetylase family protein [Roseibium hamelinense]TWI84583.1 acetoin utilization deacetylase AcuC-like enzyme [Roseibium hamelinense]